MDTTEENVRRLGAILRCGPGTVGEGTIGEVVTIEPHGVRVRWADDRIDYLHTAEAWVLRGIIVLK